MKRLLAVLMSVLMLVSLFAGCGKTDSSGDADNNATDGGNDYKMETVWLVSDEIHYDSNGSQEWRYVYKYDSNGNMTERITYDENGSQEWHYVYSYVSVTVTPERAKELREEQES